ncbi:P-loop containing nucleoside triphosphate hydrolase protein [Trichoderma longibrachiatum]|uniref:RNA helicase n=1 Tax=Trichoderma longibrachiatum ATCC 18648 TaxID=983965 RepID=A0A2T4C4V2_TRILO|nr:P-loop containing nucleoside triphosphate hydrolase protein [Trichoderma longibrachiatum ATCC 18648]
MAGAKKKKKPAANPARGFATTSVASKPRLEVTEPTGSQSTSGVNTPKTAPPAASDGPSSQSKPAEQSGEQTAAAKKVELTPEEFERQLEESELQLFVDKYAQKVKRDAQRQCLRLETDRRLLRSQAENLNTQKWLPRELMDHVLDLIKAESRFYASSLSSENAGPGKMPSEEDLVSRIWTLQQTLAGAGFSAHIVDNAIRHILDIAPNISPAPRDYIWGLEEALEWLARESPPDELPSYGNKSKAASKDAAEGTSAPPSRTSTPKLNPSQTARTEKSNAPNQRSSKTRTLPDATFNGEIEPEDLIPEYVATKAKLLEWSYLEKASKSTKQQKENDKDAVSVAYLESKLKTIESDVLFDKFLAEQQWKKDKVDLEKQLALARKTAATDSSSQPQPEDTAPLPEADDDITAIAEQMAKDLLAENNEDEDITGLFESLPQSEVDPTTGKLQTVVNTSDGARLVIREFAKWTGVSPKRILEEACRSRDPSVNISYTVVSEATFANRHSVVIGWSKPQDAAQVVANADIEAVIESTRFKFTMAKVATPDVKQSEAYIATAALFHIFSGNPKEEKVNLRLPTVWRDFWSEMAEAKKEHFDAQDRLVVKQIKALVRQRQDQELEDGVVLQGAFRGRNNAKSTPEATDSGHTERSRHVESDDNLKKLWAARASRKKYEAMLQFREQLPMWRFKDHVLDAVDKNQVIIICGETGCGKSTQVPAFLLEHELSQGRQCKIFCTEPRRISAISLARRVSEELGDEKGDLGTSRSLVGYSIRLESNTSKETRLVYATTGIVMRMLEGSNDLHEVTHLVLDEVHERSIDSDFLLIVLKRLLKRRKDLKVILMSATVDAERFSAYLDGAPVLNVPGRTFPVMVRYLEDAVELTGYVPSNSESDRIVDLDDDTVEPEVDGLKAEMVQSLAGYSNRTKAVLAQMNEYQIDHDLIVELIARIAVDESLQQYSNAILVFLPGIGDIRSLNDLLLGDPRFSAGWLVYPLHSTIAMEDQEAAFLVPPQGMRKIVLATNIAETGITIPDVTCVIDTGKHREMRFDEKKQLSRLIDTFISRANAKQRRGRAGRVQNGLCFHMFSRYRHDTLMSDQQTPEMLRLSLQDLAIRVKICKLGGIEETLSDALDPPSAKNIRRAVDALVDVRALTGTEDLTPLGYQLARLPLDVFLGKLILLGTVFKCLDMAITVAAILSSKSPFSAPFGQQTQANNARAAFRRADSDILTTYNAYLAWKRVCQANGGFGKEFQFCRKNYLNQQTLTNIEDLKGQLLTSLADSGFLSLTEEERRALLRLRFSAGGRGRRQQFVEVPQRVNLNSDNDVVSTSVIAWSFYPKLLVRDIPGSKGLRNIGNNQSISLHPTSVNRGLFDARWLSYYTIMQTKSVYRAHETTVTEPFAIALLCGDVRCDLYSGVIVLDGNRGRFAVPDWKTMLVIKVLRTRLRELLTRSFKQPGKLLTAQQEKWFDVWQRLFSQDFNQDRTVNTISL